MSSVDSTLIAPIITTRHAVVVRYTKIILQRFFQSLFDEQAKAEVKTEARRSQVSLFCDQLSHISKWSRSIIENATRGLLLDISRSHEEFDLQKELKNFLVPHLCVIADGGHCARQIILTSDHVRDFLHNLLTDCADHLIKVATVFEPNYDYMDRMRILDIIYTKEIEQNLISFVQMYKHSILTQIDGNPAGIIRGIGDY